MWKRWIRWGEKGRGKKIKNGSSAVGDSVSRETGVSWTGQTIRVGEGA
ncbi:hypothetical protein PDE_07012 [Penicillium oxalicum 114-2]|uniref:Uncharacterized protein n=1 Tax=Penicillium oxalicum (strain 114-2 / CGMCC 5302) TaxID=933388 RepID=S8B005_PENO1|nr:hypothetical protein PDE_07012 [Penicillium oxalicum 114-2]